MNRNKPTIIAAGLGGVAVVAGLAFGAAAATAQDNEDPTLEESTTTTETPSNDDTDTDSPWPGGDIPWRTGEDRAGGPGFGGLPFGGPGFGGPGFGAGMDSLADDLGMTADELTAAFETGQTLPEIAEAAGIDLDELFAGRHDDALASIEDKVASGELTQEQADAISERIAGFANGETPWGENGPGFGRAGEGRPGFGGPGFGFGTARLAETLDMTVDELAAAFESGQTLPEITEQAGIDLDETFADRGSFRGEGQAPWGDGPPPWATGDEADS